MNKHNKLDANARVERRFSTLRLLIAVAIALAIAYLLISFVSDNPGEDFLTLLVGPLSNKSRLISVVNKMIPLLFTGTAVCLVFSCGQITVACEGAFFAGAVASTVIATMPGIPVWLHIPLCLLAGGVAGAVVVAIPTMVNIRYNVLTIVAALLINNIVLYLGMYLICNPLRDPAAGYEASYKFAETSLMPSLFGVSRIHLGLIIGLVFTALGFIIMYRTPYGIEIRTVGNNRNFSNYSGISIGKVSILTAMLAGCMAGVGGTTEVLGNYQRFSYPGLTGHGWDGIVIAVLCHNNPQYVPIAALFMAFLSVSADSLNFSSSIPPEIINVIQPIIIVFVAAEKLLSGMEHKAIVKASKQTVQEHGGGN